MSNHKEYSTVMTKQTECTVFPVHSISLVNRY